MGIFDRFKKTIEAEYKFEPSGEHEAWLGILYACVAADGEVVKIEENALSLMLITKKKFDHVNIQALYRNVLEAHYKLGGAKLVDACYNLVKEEDRATLFAMSVELVLADGILDEDEEQIIEYIARKLQIDEKLVQCIVEVMLLRNKGNHVFF